MANMKQIKAKIKATASIKKTTRALEIVSTIKLQKLKQKTISYRNYLKELLGIMDILEDKKWRENAIKIISNRHCIIVISSEKWLCWPLNTKIFRLLEKDIKTHWRDNIDIITIGRKAYEYCTKRNYNIIHHDSVNDVFNMEDIAELNTIVRKHLIHKTYGSINIIFNYFKSIIQQVPTTLEAFPFNQEKIRAFFHEIWIVHRKASKKIDNIIYEPDQKRLKKQLVDHFVQQLIHGALLQNKAWEMASRMIAMKNAKDNASSMIKDLTVSFNKARQAAITQEITEIVSAKFSME